MRPVLPVLALLALSPLAVLAEEPAGDGAACEVPGNVMTSSTRIDAGPTQAIRIRFTLAQPFEGDVAVWFALRGSLLEPGWPAERALAAGFLETTDGEAVALVSPQLGIYPYGLQADLAAAGLRVPVTDGPCLGAFGAISNLRLDAGEYDFVVVGAAEGGSRFAAFLPPEAVVTDTATGPAQLLSASAFPCLTKARTFASGVLVEALRDCSVGLTATGKSYRSLVATWGPTDLHHVRWVTPSGAVQRCYKAPGWCVDTVADAPGAWTLEVPAYLTLRQPHALLPGGVEGYSGLFGVFAGRP